MSRFKMSHYDSLEIDELMQCDQCTYTTYWEKNFRKHYKTMHSGQPRKEKRFQCDKCDKKLDDNWHLKEHIRYE